MPPTNPFKEDIAEFQVIFEVETHDIEVILKQPLHPSFHFEIL
jgi:hypothetical protein